MSPKDIYSQSIDKQRIIIVGEGGDLITSLVIHVLQFHQKKFDVYNTNEILKQDADSSIVIFHSQQLTLDFNHHILLMGYDVHQISDLSQLADATPKAGIIIYPSRNAGLTKIATKERADIQSFAYDVFKHEIKNNNTILITSTNEKFAIHLSGSNALQCVSAVRELVKKIGISSSQFYSAMSHYKA